MRSGGEFIIDLPSGDELVLPNQFTIIGAQQVLKAAFWQQALDWYVGLCAHNPGDSVPLGSLGEPEEVNGYARQALPGNLANWPTVGIVNGENYVESRLFTFTATGAYTHPINRLFLTDGTYVMAISSALPDGLTFIDSDLQQRYRLYLR